jgi:mono/diheme cytochrome c family protein
MDLKIFGKNYGGNGPSIFEVGYFFLLFFKVMNIFLSLFFFFSLSLDPSFVSLKPQPFLAIPTPTESAIFDQVNQVQNQTPNSNHFLEPISSRFSISQKKKAQNIEKGERLFLNHCMACHEGRENFIIPEKNLQKETLEINGLTSVESLTYYIKNGKNGMPAFGGRLSEKSLIALAKYLLEN